MPNWNITFVLDGDFLTDMVVPAINSFMAIDVLQGMFPDDDIKIIDVERIVD